MYWSQLKKKIESNFCEPLRKRIALHVVLYRTRKTPHIALGEMRILVDRLIVFRSNSHEAEIFWNAVCQQVKMDQTVEKKNRYLEAGRRMDKLAMSGHENSQRILQDYLSYSIDEAMASEKILIRALGMIDRRLGKRRLVRIKLKEDEHPLIRLFYELRRFSEGLGPEPQLSKGCADRVRVFKKSKQIPLRASSHV